MTAPSFHDHLESILSDESGRRRFAQNSLIVDVAVSLNKALEASGLTQKELAARLSKTEGFVSQVLNGGANMTLRTLGDIAYGLNCVVDVSVRPHDVPVSAWTSNIQPILACPALEREKAANTQLALAA